MACCAPRLYSVSQCRQQSTMSNGFCSRVALHKRNFVAVAAHSVTFTMFYAFLSGKEIVAVSDVINTGQSVLIPRRYFVCWL